MVSVADAGVEGVEDREASEAFSPPGLAAEGALSGALTAPVRLADTPAAAAERPVAMADTGLG